MDYWWNRWKVWGALYMSLNMYTQDVILEPSGKAFRLTAMTPGGTYHYSWAHTHYRPSQYCWLQYWALAPISGLPPPVSVAVEQ